MFNYKNEKILVDGCPGCAYANHEFELPCKMAYEDELFTLSQDWELPIPGFMVVSPKRCVEKFEELTTEEKIKIYELVDLTIKALRNNNICDRFNVLFEEKENRHFHIWIMPRYDWMKESAGGITSNIGKVFEYAKENMRTEEIYIDIEKANNIVRKALIKK